MIIQFSTNVKDGATDYIYLNPERICRLEPKATVAGVTRIYVDKLAGFEWFDVLESSLTVQRRVNDPHTAYQSQAV